MDYIETKYILLLSPRLRNFHRKGPNVYNFSCPICGDSKSHKRRARGYLLEKQGKIGYYCHNDPVNCSSSFSDFLKNVAPDLYGPYHFEKFRKVEEKSIFERIPLEKPKFMNYGVLSQLKKISDLPQDDPIKLFVISRMIPEAYHGKLFACDKFMHWVNEIIPGKFAAKDLVYDEPRLVIPFMDKEKNTFAFQGRAIRPGGPKYITISLNKSEHIVYGRDTVEPSDTIYVLEGPIDSMFVPNSIAVASSNLLVASLIFPKEKLVLIFDNEPRNENIVQMMKRAITTDHQIVIFPESFKYKDINEAILNGVSPTSIMTFIENNVCSGLTAELVLAAWRK